MPSPSLNNELEYEFEAVDKNPAISSSYHDPEGERNEDDFFYKFNEISGWQSLLLLQFQGQMLTAVILSIYVCYILAITDMAFALGTKLEKIPVSLAGITSTVMYIFDFFYLLDVICMFIFKYSRWPDMKLRAYSRHGAMLTLELISIIPIDMIYYVQGEANMQLFYCLRLRYVLRLSRFISFFKLLKLYFGRSSLLYIVAHLGIQTLLVVSCSSASYIYKCNRKGVTCEYRDVPQMGHSSYIAASIFSMIGVTGHDKDETLLNNIFLSLFVFLLYSCFLGYYVCVVIQLFSVKFRHLRLYAKLQAKVRRWRMFTPEWTNYHKKFEKLIHDYGTLMWEVSETASPEQYYRKIIPDVLYEEIYVDIFWFPLKHTHLFRNEDHSFVIALSRMMKRKTYAAGEPIYKRDKYKSCMIYIISGIVNILSEEDTETAIISLAGGTCMGEASLVIDYPSTCFAVSKNICEVMVLERKDFIRLSDLYPEQCKRVRQVILKRCRKSVLLKVISKYQLDTLEIREKIDVITMKWLKLKMRALLHAGQEMDLQSRTTMNQLEDLYFTTTYLDMIVLAEDIELMADSVFVKSTFPFIFKQKSGVVRGWNIFVFVLILLLSLSYPFYAVFLPETPTYYRAFLIFINIIWLIDVYFSISTAIITRHYSCKTIADILMHKLGQAEFIIDILAAIPTINLYYIFKGTVPAYVGHFIEANRVLKVYKIESFFENMRTSLQKQLMLKFIKFLLYLLLINYYVAAVLYKLVCSDRMNCKAAFQKFLDDFGIERSFDRVMICTYSVMQAYGDMSLTSFPYTGGTNSLLIFLQLIIFLFSIFFLSHICIIHVLNRQNVYELQTLLRDTEATVKCFGVRKSLQKRIWKFILIQDENSSAHFLYGIHFLRHLPQDLFVMARSIQLSASIKSVQLFYDLNERVLSDISSIAYTHLVAPHEVIRNIGEICTEIHIIVKGCCKIVFENGTMKTAEAGESILILEGCLSLPSMSTILTMTACKIVSVNVRKMMGIFLRHPRHHSDLRVVIEKFKRENPLVRPKKHHAQKIVTGPKKAQQSFRVLGYRLKRRAAAYFEFHDVFPKWALPFKYLLLGVTFHCNGWFVLMWEIFRCIFAFASCILLPLYSAVQYNSLYYVCLFLDITAYLDIYVRHHISYFNHNGIEVFHPFRTAVYYWKHGLLVDFLGSFRITLFNYFLHFDMTYVHCLAHLLQLYRVRAILVYMFGRRLSTSIRNIVFTVLPFILAFINLAGYYIFRFFCDITVGQVTCQKGTWFEDKSEDSSPPIKMYVLSVFFVTSVLANTCFSKITIKTYNELLTCTLCSLAGYILFYYTTTNIISANLFVSNDLYMYQNSLKALLKFVGRARIDKCLRQELVRHFEVKWKKSRGKTVHQTFALFKTSLKVDVLYDIYGLTFDSSTIFLGYNRPFFRSLLAVSRPEFFLGGGLIYQVNDVSCHIYFLVKGQVEVVGADSNRLLTLHTGSIFGNLENKPLGRMTLTMVASGYVEVLVFTSEQFHQTLHYFPDMRKQFSRHTVFHVDFVQEAQLLMDVNLGPTLAPIPAKALTNLQNLRRRCRFRTPIFSSGHVLIRIWDNLIVTISSLASYLFTLFCIASLDTSLGLLITFYITDFIFLLKIFMGFHTSYQNEFGEEITDRRKIAMRYLNSKAGFYFDLVSVFPVDVFVFIFLNTREFRWIYPLSRINRLLRIYFFMKYLYDGTQKLHVNTLVMRMVFILTRLLLTIFTLGSFIQLSVTAFDTEHVQKKRNNFLELITFVHAVTNATAKLAFNINIATLNIMTALCLIFVIITCKIVSVTFIAETCALFQIGGHMRGEYSQFVNFIKSFMTTEGVSLSLLERIHTYTKLFWIYHKGVHYPVLLKEAPYYLREALLNSMFGFHISNHPVLKHCHVDLIRQITAQLRTLVFFPGDVIAYKNSSDQCMYFIHDGEVDALSEDTMQSEMVDHTLHIGDMFGLDQGIYRRSFHEYTYRIKEYSVIICLRREDWIHLLDFFPASKEMIYDPKKER